MYVDRCGVKVDTDRETDSETDRETDRETERETERQTGTETKTGFYSFIDHSYVALSVASFMCL